MEKLKISQAVVVEGKYDKIKLASLIDAVIIVTNGFGVYKNKDTAELIRYYAKKQGIIVLTDSDTAGFRIRGHIKSIVPEGTVINLYAPEVFGKEKRKDKPSKEGKLGIEGIAVDRLKEVFEKAGVTTEKTTEHMSVTSLDFYELGLTGHPNSSALRAKVIERLDLPKLLTPKALLEVINTMFERKDFIDFINSERIDEN